MLHADPYEGVDLRQDVLFWAQRLSEQPVQVHFDSARVRRITAVRQSQPILIALHTWHRLVVEDNLATSLAEGVGRYFNQGGLLELSSDCWKGEVSI